MFQSRSGVAHEIHVESDWRDEGDVRGGASPTWQRARYSFALCADIVRTLTSGSSSDGFPEAKAKSERIKLVTRH